jgi:predicted Rdx family selenoprotein
LKRELGVDVELVKGSGGVFVVDVDGVTVARKTPAAGFPTEAQVVEAVRVARAA